MQILLFVTCCWKANSDGVSSGGKHGNEFGRQNGVDDWQIHVGLQFDRRCDVGSVHDVQHHTLVRDCVRKFEFSLLSLTKKRYKLPESKSSLPRSSSESSTLSEAALARDTSPPNSL